MRKRTREDLCFLRDRAVKDREAIDALTAQSKAIQSRLKVLECPHNHTELTRYSSSGGGQERCLDCGKVLAWYTPEEFLAERLAHTQEYCKEKTASLKVQLKDERERIKEATA